MSAEQQQDDGRGAGAHVDVRPLTAADVDEADRVMRTAFGTFIGVPEPLTVFGDAEYVRPRFAAEPDWAFAAERDGEVVGSIFAARWGSFGMFGPLSVREDLWDRGIARRLMVPVMDLFEAWRVRQAGLYTFAQSPKHVGLYQRFGFWPQHLTAIMSKSVASFAGGLGYTSYSSVVEAGRGPVVQACRELTDAIFEGLDLTHEIGATDAQRLGEVVLLGDPARLDAFAICHCGAGEAGSGSCLVKFGAARPGPGAGDRFDRLLDACEQLAADRGVAALVAGVNVARHDAYRRMLARGYRTRTQGVRMHSPNDPGYCRPDAYVIDDLR